MDEITFGSTEAGEGRGSTAEEERGAVRTGDGDGWRLTGAMALDSETGRGTVGSRGGTSLAMLMH